MNNSETATERLREMLDARGVEWYEPPTKPNKTWFPDENGINCCARPWSDALEIRRHGLTPEQAIAATLGSGECEMEGVDIDCDTASEWMLDRFCVFDAVYKCSCGDTFGHSAKKRPQFCPHCGKAVKR